MSFEVKAVRDIGAPICDSEEYPLDEFDMRTLESEHDIRFLLTDESPVLALDSWKCASSHDHWYRLVWPHRCDIHTVLTSAFRAFETLNRTFGSTAQLKARWVNNGAFERKFEAQPQRMFENIGRELKKLEQHDVIPFADVAVLIEQIVQEGQRPYIDYSIDTSQGPIVMMCDCDEPMEGDEYQLLYVIPKSLIGNVQVPECILSVVHGTHVMERTIEYFRSGLDQLLQTLRARRIISPEIFS
ncbi:MAG: hypothetical protein PHO20_04660 [Candidatus Peribacteraceae bacterium]|nr:hypothetical protein [Candidatus Peribacteraceae bacterium]